MRMDQPMSCSRVSLRVSLRAAFSLVELLVVIAIIGMLMGLLFPALQASREASRALQCRNHMRQIAVAILNCESARGHLPPTFRVGVGADERGNWSLHGFFLPYVEGGNAYAQIDPYSDWHLQLGSGIPQLMIPFYQCPSEVNSRPRLLDGQPYVAPTNYGFNMGRWLIYDPVTGQTGDGPFRVNKSTRLAEVTDGTSNTLAVAEVKAYTSYIRNTTTIPADMPTAAADLAGLTGLYHLGPQIEQNTGHTVWPDGRVHHTGFTTTFTPNQNVAYEHDGRWYDIDLTTQQEGRGTQRPTKAAVTSRSYHPGRVNVARLDGSVDATGDDIDAQAWQGLSTIAGQEVFETGP